MKTKIYSSSYLAKFFLETYIFRTKFVDRIEHTFMFKNVIFENLTVYEIM
jgi:hypothetical protein